MKGTVVVNSYQSVRVHTYTSPPNSFLVNTQIVECPANLIIFDGQLLNPYAAEVASYAGRLGKPVDRIIVSHGHPDHWAGLEVLAQQFPTATIYALSGVIEQIRNGGEVMLTGLRRVFGGMVASKPTIPTGALTLGSQTIAGVRFEFKELRDIESDLQLMALMPDQRLMLAFDLVFAPHDHAFTVAPHFDHWISTLNDTEGIEGYDRVLIGHDQLVDMAGFGATIAYLRKAKELYAVSGDGKSYAEALKAAFPDRSQPGWVDFSGRVLFSTPHR